MYSVILLAALSTSPEAPAHHKHGGCHGCHGAGYGCNGCHGGYGCNGCHGGYGYGCNGCHGGYGCNGCHGGYGYGCNGCHGGAGCWGSGCYGCYGFYGGCAGTYYSPYHVQPMYMTHPVVPKGEPAPPPKKDDKPAPMKDDLKKEEKKDGAAAGNAAKLVVELPQGARLFVDNQPVTAAPGVRTFNTPALDRGQAYYYTVRAELVRDGRQVSETRTVIVRAGETSRVAFPELAGGAAEKPVATAAR